MMKKYLLLSLLISCIPPAISQELQIRMDETAPISQVYGKTHNSPGLLTMSDLGMESGYILYETEIESDTCKKVMLQIENVRDYAAVYLNDKYSGSLNFDENTVSLDLPQGKSVLQLYVENIGRITYGPEILDNSRGLFGDAFIDKKKLNNWKIIPLEIRECDPAKLQFATREKINLIPSFYKGTFSLDDVKNASLDMAGWGMGEIWINGQYLGAYWEEEAIKTLSVNSSVLKKGINEVVVFDIKSNDMNEIQIIF